MKTFARWLAIAFGLGLSPFAPGTVGSLLGLPLAWWMTGHLSWPVHLGVALLLTLAAIPICDIAERHYRRKDDRRIVADEWMLFPLCVVGLPPNLKLFAIAFVAARGFDILKLWPAHGLQRFRGGFGIVIDDFFAMLYALAANHAAWWALQKFGLI